jgi:superfamily I DNA/RNA helicase/RecB family exonuclease
MAPFSPDPQQAQVLAHTTGSLLVTGAAGTGKTAALQERFARLIEGGADPERVALVLGSRRARDGSRRALLQRLDASLPGLHVLTLHGLAHHVVEARHRELGYAEPPQVLSAADHFALVQQLLAAQDPADWPAYHAMLPMRGFADEVRQFLSRAQEALLTPEEIEQRANAMSLTGWLELARFLREYQQVTDETGVIDFAGMVQQAAAVAAKGDLLFDHVLVDDFQDTTLAAEELLIRLGAADVVVAGDPDAHVFSFQGTTDVPILRFARVFPDARQVELGVQHRAEVRPEVHGWCATHTSEEHAAIARELRRLHVEEGIAWGDLAVVVRRQGSHVGGLLRALDDARVPRTLPESGLSLTTEPATYPYVLALRWLAGSADNTELIEPVLTSDLARLSPAVARGLMRVAQTRGGSAAAALEHTEGLAPDEAVAVSSLRETLERAAPVADRSVTDAFKILWNELVCSARLVAAADASSDTRRELDAVVAFASVVAEAGASADPTVAGFVESLDAGEHGPGYSTTERGRPDAVHVLTAHGAAGREFDTVIVAGAVEGNFPSLSRPEPMFDLSALDGPAPQSERNRIRSEDERRLFRMVLARARRSVLLTASDAHGHGSATSTTSRFADELGVEWQAVPQGPFDEPVSVREAAAAWRRDLADLTAPHALRLASVEGLVALGIDPGHWWYQREWTDTGQPLHDHLYLSYSRLDRLQNCELQHVLADELGLGRPGGYHAWVGKTVHKIIEECERGEIEKTPKTIAAVLDERWRPQEFPSMAVSEAYRWLAKSSMLKNWFDAYADKPALGIEKGFEFEYDGVTMIGYIDRIGPAVQEGTVITDFKTGKAEHAGKPEENLQLGIYYLAVQESPDLAEYRPVKMLELAFLKGHWRTGDIEFRKWPVSAKNEETYELRMREQLSGLIAKKKELTETEVYRPDPYANCFFCEFKTLCPLYPEGQEPFGRDEAMIR